MLSANHIDKRIGTNQLLTDVSVQITPGRATAVVGPNGSGKSTLLRALALVDPPTAGTVGVDERLYRFGSATAAAPMPWPLVTIVFQQLFLWPHLTLRENILLPLRRRSSQQDVRGAVESLAHDLAVEGFLDRHPNEVSLGERQRAAIIRAVLLRPTYLLLDEATAALDVENTQRVFELLMRLKREGVGLAFVTHFLGFARRLADEVVFLEHGRLLEEGSPEILTQPRTERMQRFVSLLESGTTA